MHQKKKDLTPSGCYVKIYERMEVGLFFMPKKQRP